MSQQSGGSFSQGVGQWIGAAEVYDAAGRFAGHGRDTRTVQADDDAGRVTVDVSFDGPFSVAGVYTIADHGTHRIYEGPLNYGYAEALGDGLISANNYWHQLGLSQRFFLMVLPDGTRQLSLAIISAGEQLHWTVVGEYQRQTDPAQPQPPATVPMDPAVLADDPTAGRGQVLLHRAGRWSGQLTVLDADLEAGGSTSYVESVHRADEGVRVELTDTGFASDVAFEIHTDGWLASTPPGPVVGSYNLSGGRGMSGSLLHQADALRVWRREVAALDGTMKGVVHTWYRGDQRVGVAHGVLEFEPADG